MFKHGIKLNCPLIILFCPLSGSQSPATHSVCAGEECRKECEQLAVGDEQWCLPGNEQSEPECPTNQAVAEDEGHTDGPIKLGKLDLEFIINL